MLVVYLKLVKMWIPFVCDQINYVLRFDSTSYTFFLSNLQQLWSTIFTRDDLIKRFQESNPQLDLNNTREEDVTKQIDEIISEINDGTVTIVFEEEILNFDLKVKISDLPIVLNLALHKQSTDNVFKEVLIPLIETVQYLEIREKKLFTLIDQSGNKDIKTKFNRFEANSRIKTGSLFLQTFTTKCRNFVEIFTNRFSSERNVLTELDRVTVKRKKLVSYKKIK